MGVLSDRQIVRELAGRIKPFAPEQISKGVISSGLSSMGYDLKCGFKFKVFSNVWGSVIDPKKFDPKAFVDVELTPGHLWSNTGNHFVCERCFTHANRPGMEELMVRNNCQSYRNHVLLPPNSFALAETVEWIDMPRDLLGIVIGKSTLARCGLVLPMTPLEPEWSGRVTLELVNSTPLPMKVYAGEGIAQLLFFRSDERLEKLIEMVENNVAGWRCTEEVLAASCGTSYADRSGKYQNQSGLTLPSVEN